MNEAPCLADKVVVEVWVAVVDMLRIVVRSGVRFRCGNAKEERRKDSVKSARRDGSVLKERNW